MRRLRRKWLGTLDNVGRSKWLPGVSGLWVALAVSYFGLETLGYRGLTAWLGEWEYGNWGQYLPWMTYLVLVFVFTVPVLLLFAYLRRRVRQPSRAEIPMVVASVVRSENALFNFLAFCSSVVLVIGLGALLGALALPRVTEPARTVTVQAGAVQAEMGGSTRLSGIVVYSRTARFQRDVFFLHPIAYFAPVVATTGGSGAGRYFVEIPLDGNPIKQDSRLVSYTGILQRNGLPGPIRALYNSVGINVADPNYVLFTSRAALSWPYYEVALNALVMGVILLILTIFQWRRLKRATIRAKEAQSSSMDWAPA